jgi:hypothetical protein
MGVGALALANVFERVALSIHHATCNLRPLCFHRVLTLLHKQHGLRENVTEHKICVLIFSTKFI